MLGASVQFSSVAQSYLTLCDPMNRSMPGLPVHHQLPEFTQTHVHRISDAIQPSCPQNITKTVNGKKVSVLTVTANSTEHLLFVARF